MFRPSHQIINKELAAQEEEMRQSQWQ